jgi:uncharacterized protein (DUF4415 family)
MKPQVTSKPAANDLTDWERVDALTDAEIDLSEHPEWTDADFERAERRGSPKSSAKQPISIRLSPEVLDWFRSTGAGWQTRIDRVLREYVERQRPPR